jgi:hypothetical protein
VKQIRLDKKKENGNSKLQLFLPKRMTGFKWVLETNLNQFSSSKQKNFLKKKEKQIFIKCLGAK